MKFTVLYEEPWDEAFQTLDHTKYPSVQILYEQFEYI